MNYNDEARLKELLQEAWDKIASLEAELNQWERAAQPKNRVPAHLNYHDMVKAYEAGKRDALNGLGQPKNQEQEVEHVYQVIGQPGDTTFDVVLRERAAARAEGYALGHAVAGESILELARLRAATQPKNQEEEREHCDSVAAWQYGRNASGRAEIIMNERAAARAEVELKYQAKIRELEEYKRMYEELCK